MTKIPEHGCDILIISPHTDDLEIGLGGTAALLSRRGRTVWGLDLTAGELGSNATPEERWEEAGKASAVLGLSGRVQLDLPDGFIDPASAEQVGSVVWMLRSLRPRWIVTAPDAHRHPDHLATPDLVARAAFHSALVAYEPVAPRPRIWDGGQTPDEPLGPWRAEAVFGVCGDHQPPALIFDVTSSWEAKVRALTCFASQFQRAGGRRPTAINQAGFLEKIERRARTWGRRGGVDMAEALCSRAVPILDDLTRQEWI